MEHATIEKEYKAPSFSPTELVELFPDALPIIKKNLRQWRKIRKESEPLYSEILDLLMEEIYATPKALYNDPLYTQERALAWATRNFYERPIGILDGHVKRLSHLESLYQYKGSASAGTIDDKAIETARSIPIGNFIEINRAHFSVCIFHSEKTPSCKIFSDNKFRCFGCGKNGDVIDIIMKMKGIEFIDAVKFLLKR